MTLRSVSLPDRRTSGLLLFASALVAALALWLAVSAPAQAKSGTVHVDGVQTSLTTAQGTTALLFGAGIIPMPVWPSPVTFAADGTATYTFPITGGKVDATTLVGNICHAGGIVLVKNTGTGWKTLSLTRFTITIPESPATPTLSAIVNGGGRATIADLSLAGATITRFEKHHRTFVKIDGVGVALNGTAVGAINATFGTSLKAPVTLGTAAVLARVGCGWCWHWGGDFPWMRW